MTGERKLLVAALVAGVLCLITSTARANGRLPAATGLAIHPTDPQQMLLGLTFGLALTRDGGATWTWMCEGQIEGNGLEIDPATVMTGDGTLVVLSLTNRGLLISRDDGCTFERPLGPLQDKRGVDLTLDPSQPGRVLALMSTIIPGSSDKDPRFDNLVAHSLDHGRNWEILSKLPEELIPETLEVAPSDTHRIYVTGVAGSNQLKGMVQRSDDGGQTWKQTTVDLPRGSGSMFLSAIHPKDPNRLWIRAPRRGDIYGVLPTKLWMSMDGGASFDQVGETEGGMLGFALSPEGDRIAFGGPSDGLFIAPSDASEASLQLTDMPVSCLRWRENGLYACALESVAPFGLGLAAEPMQRFVPLWHRAGSCRATCAPPSRLEALCRAPWDQLAPLLDASMPLCDGSASMPDAGSSVRPGVVSNADAGAEVADASIKTHKPTEPGPRSDGCSVTPSSRGRTAGRLMLLPVLVLVGWRRKVRRAQRYGAFGVVGSQAQNELPIKAQNSKLRLIWQRKR